MSIYCQAIHPDGRTLTFDDVLTTGQLVDDGAGTHFLVGLDRGDEYPLLHLIGRDEYLAWWNEQRRIEDDRRARPVAPVSAPVEDGAAWERDARDGYDSPSAERARELLRSVLDEPASIEALVERSVERLVEEDLLALNASATAFLVGGMTALLTAQQRERLLEAASDEPHVLVHARRLLDLAPAPVEEDAREVLRTRWCEGHGHVEVERFYGSADFTTASERETCPVPTYKEEPCCEPLGPVREWVPAAPVERDAVAVLLQVHLHPGAPETRRMVERVLVANDMLLTPAEGRAIDAEARS